jgi:hypothetical protein
LPVFLRTCFIPAATIHSQRTKRIAPQPTSREARRSPHAPGAKIQYASLFPLTDLFTFPTEIPRQLPILKEIEAVNRRYEEEQGRAEDIGCARFSASTTI